MWALAVAAILGGLSYLFIDSKESVFANPAAFSSATEIKVAALPHEARLTLALIKKGGPFPFDKDGVVFGNREKLLPKKSRDYYSEYTVTTPGERNRGARRIVTGGDPKTSGEFYYTDDHYRSFKRIRE